MEGGVKIIPGLFDPKRKKAKKTKKNNKVESTLTVIKTKKQTLHLKHEVHELIGIDYDPNVFLPKAAILIKKLLKVSKKASLGTNTKKVDGFILTLVNALYYAFKKENNINYNSNSTEASIDESDIWNDPYSLLKTLVKKLDILMETDDEEFKLEISETIRSALQYGYNKTYVEHKNVEVNQLSNMFSKL